MVYGWIACSVVFVAVGRGVLVGVEVAGMMVALAGGEEEALDERPIDLHEAGGEVAKVAQGRVAGTEIVDANVDAHVE